MMGKHDTSDDRDWLERNQERSHRARMPFGELDEEVAKTPAGCTLIILVRQVEPGSRLRGGLFINAILLPLPDDEAVAHTLFEVAVRREAVRPTGRRSAPLSRNTGRTGAGLVTPKAITGSGRAGEIAHHHQEPVMAQIKAVEVEKVETLEESVSIAKPGEFDLDKFKAKQTATVANVETLQSPLPVHNMAAAKDFVRLHPDEKNYWSDELCFVDVPIKGQKRNTLHLIVEALALQFLESGEILRFRLALASKPNDVFFLCEVPTQNLDNIWNITNVEGCEKAKTLWTKMTSRKSEGAEGYKITSARDPDSFSNPSWPTQSLGELIARAFAGRMIETEDHPALLRKIGARQSLS